MKPLSVLLSLSLGLLSLSANGGIIFDNGGPDPDLGWPYSDFGFPQEVADDFELMEGENVLRDIHWWGGYGGPASAPEAVEDFTIRIFENDAGKPSGDDFQTVVFLTDPSRELVEAPGSNFEEFFKYSVDIEPLVLAANTTFWVSIVNDTPPAFGWLWAKTVDTGGNAAGRDDSADAWSTQQSDQAFYLTDDVTAVPEPTSLALLGIGLAGLGLGLTRRRTRRGVA